MENKLLVPRLRFPEFQDSQGWKQRPLGSEALFFKGRGVSKAEIDPNGSYPCIRYGELYTRYGEVIDAVYSRTSAPVAELFLSSKNDVIIPASGETKEDIARASCVTFDGVALGGDINVLRTKHNGVFLSYLINGVHRRAIAKVAQGDTVVHLYPSQLAQVSIALPEASEQQKIAECLTSLDELIAAEGRKLEALRGHKKGLMQNLFPREGESVPRLRFPTFHYADEWEATNLGSIAIITSGTTPLRSNPEFYAGGTIPWVKTADLNNAFITDTEERITLNARARINPVGSVLVAMYGGFNQIGRTGLLTIPAATNQAISVLNVQAHAMPEFVQSWLNARIDKWKKIASSSRKDPNVTGNDVAAFAISVPSKPEQRLIADCLASLDALITAQAKKLGTLNLHKQGLLQCLFPSTEAAEA